MIFNSSSTVKSTQSADELRKFFLGQHLSIHELDFEITQLGDVMHVVPNIADSSHMYTLPVTQLNFSSAGNTTDIKITSQPRRIDVGGPYLLMIFIVFAFITAFLLLKLGGGNYNNTAYIMIGIAGIILITLYYRLYIGYYDYVRKIVNWVKDHA
jgi:hypothetical protein